MIGVAIGVQAWITPTQVLAQALLAGGGSQTVVILLQRIAQFATQDLNVLVAA